jgi:hypothetical protein
MEPATSIRETMRKGLAAIAKIIGIDTPVGFDPVRTIADLDLSKVSINAMRRHNWTAEETEEAEADYRRFLYLMYRYPTEIMVPWSINLDLFWHGHILDTEKYSKDCQRIFGKFIHHDPNIRLVLGMEARARQQTAFLFSVTFQPDRTEGRKRSPSWLIPSARTTAIIAALSPASAQEYSNRRQKEWGGCGGVCGGGS